MDGTEQMMGRIGAAVERGRAGEPADARTELGRLWAEIGPDGDPLHRCVLAHHLADLQDDVRDELAWDERALAAVPELSDRRVQQEHASLQVRGLLPSLHLNLADDHRRLGATERARAHLDSAREHLGALADDGYGAMIRNAVEDVADALAAGSVERRPGSPSTR